MRIVTILLLIVLGITAQQKGPQPALHIVTYVDVYPNFAAEAATLMSQMAVESRKEAGNVRFEVLRDTTRSNHFAIVEVWQTRQAFDTHTAAAHVRSVREKMQPSLGSPYDERLYNALP
jgi:quinol monooxygenase YgiN